VKEPNSGSRRNATTTFADKIFARLRLFVLQASCVGKRKKKKKERKKRERERRGCIE
jgi:hypothetical protein